MLYPVVNNDTINLTAEWCGGFWMMHCDVKTAWSKSLRDAMTDLMKRVATVSEYPVFAFQGPSCDPKKRKFIRQIGGIPDHFAQNDKGELVEVFRFSPLD